MVCFALVLRKMAYKSSASVSPGFTSKDGFGKENSLLWAAMMQAVAAYCKARPGDPSYRSQLDGHDPGPCGKRRQRRRRGGRPETASVMPRQDRNEVQCAQENLPIAEGRARRRWPFLGH